MNNKDIFRAMGGIDSQIIRDAAPDKVQKKQGVSIWIKIGALAACLAIILSSVLALRKPVITPGGDIEPYIPTGQPFIPILGANVSEITLNATEVGKIFDMYRDNEGTNQYVKIYSAKPEYLNISPLQELEYLPVYSENNSPVTKEKLKTFIHKYLATATEFYGIQVQEFEIETDDRLDGSVIYKSDVEDREIGRGVYFYASGNSARLNIFSWGQYDNRMDISGSLVSVLESDTDDQIKEKLKDTIDKISSVFQKDYTGIKIQRSYSYDQLKRITIYLFNPEGTTLPEDFMDTPMVSEYITLEFETDWGEGTTSHWGGSPDEAFLISIRLNESIQPWSDYYSVMGKSKMLTLKEAEKMLKKGYVFGGHACPLCMAEQTKVDFDKYTAVNIEYLRGKDGVFIPFYAFYKNIGLSDNGIPTYACTYVAAVYLEGLEKYFNIQMREHGKTSLFDFK